MIITWTKKQLEDTVAECELEYEQAKVGLEYWKERLEAGEYLKEGEDEQ